MKVENLHSKDSSAYIRALLQCNDRAVERAMVVIYNNQTEDEQAEETTKHQNGRGFNSFDARMGCYYARWVLSGKNLTGTHLEKARKMAGKYVGQLVEAAQKKAEGKKYHEQA